MTTSWAPRLLVTYDYAPQRGGAARYHTAVVDTLGSRGSVMVPTRDRHWLRLLPTLWRRCRAGGVAQILVGEVLPLGTVAMLLRLVGGPPYVIICHGLDLRSAGNVPRKRWLTRHVLRRAHRIVANSAHTASIAQSFGVPPDRIVVVLPPIGITPQLTRSASVPDVRAEHDLAHARIVLSVCRLVKRKGTDVLIAAMGEVRRTYPRVTLVIIGDGPERAALEAAARAHRISVRFLGALDDVHIAAWYQACDVFVLLPRELGDGDVEGFGIVYLEANAFGKPVIGTRSGGVPDAVIDGETGILVRPNDVHAATNAIVRIFRDAPFARRLGERGRQRADQEFTAARFAEQINLALAP